MRITPAETLSLELELVNPWPIDLGARGVSCRVVPSRYTARRTSPDRKPASVSAGQRIDGGRQGVNLCPLPCERVPEGRGDLRCLPSRQSELRRCQTESYLALSTAGDPLLEAVDLHGAHDFRHTFATWLEDAGIPARVIDEVMGHEATSRVGQQRGSAMGAHYRHTTPEMAARIAIAIEQRLTAVLEVAEQALEAQPRRSAQRVF